MWYDMHAQDLNAAGMEDGIRNSRNVLIFLSDGVMGRSFCQSEQRWGKQYGCGFVGVASAIYAPGPGTSSSFLLVVAAVRLSKNRSAFLNIADVGLTCFEVMEGLIAL